MGSDVAARAVPLEPTSARARRSLMAARVARDGISTMVDALRVSKPPRAPAKHSPSSVPPARKHALIPHAEGRAQLEARIHGLEDVVAAKDAELVALKRQWGRALVKRKHFEKDRDAAREQAHDAKERARATRAAAAAERKRMLRSLADVLVPLPALKEVAEKCRKGEGGLADEVLVAVGDISETVAETREHLEAHPLPEVATEVANGVGGVVSMRMRSYTGSITTDEEDGKSVVSCASSTAFGDDRELQVAALAELVEILDAKLANGPPHLGAAATVLRARKTLKGSKAPTAEEMREIVAERDTLRKQLDAVMVEKESVGGEDAALALAARAEADLRDAREELDAMRDRLKRLEKVAERGLKTEAVIERNATLEGELISAKKSVGRLVQERNSLRRTTTNSLFSNASNASKTPRGANDEARKRILEWRQRASSRNLGNETTNVAPVPFASLESEGEVERIPLLPARIDGAEPLPDRVTTPAFTYDMTMKKRRTSVLDSDSVRTKEETSFSDRSVDAALNDSVSAQSVPVQGFLRRHDSFLSAGDVSASGDEITIRNNRNIFNMKTPKVQAGLGSLFGAPSHRFITRQ